MSAAPSSTEVLEAIEGGRVTSLRKVELYESDAETLWVPEGTAEPVSRLEGGAVTVDYSRDERRSFDLSLDNADNALRPDSEDGFWYDKIVKAYRGVRYQTSTLPPRVAIVYEDAANQAEALRATLRQVGFSRVDLKLSATTVEELRDYEIIVSHGRLGAAGKSALMAALYDAGKKVMTTGNASTSTEVPLILASGSTATITWGITPVSYDTPVAAGWTTESQGSDSGRTVTAVRTAARVVASYLNGGTEHYTAIIEENQSTGGRWFHYHPHSFGTQAKTLLKNALNWLWDYEPFKEWTTQVGEFVIDNISEESYPHLTKVTGRDYTKRCLDSKLEQSASFAAGTPLDDLVRFVGANAGLVKFNLPATGLTLSERIDFERGTERWRIMAAAANAHNYELYFDPQGYLTMREYLDPSFSPISQSFRTGTDGNLVRWGRSTNDSRIYNHIVVTGEREGDSLLPFFGEAKNEEPSSPTRIGRIGDRSYFFTSSFFTSSEQCIAYANSLLKIHALESYELNFESLLYPWAEVGEIVEFLDPRRNDGEPTRFLLDSLSIPLGLGTMSGTGKRVTFVNDPSLVA